MAGGAGPPGGVTKASPTNQEGDKYDNRQGSEKAPKRQ